MVVARVQLGKTVNLEEEGGTTNKTYDFIYFGVSLHNFKVS